MLGIWISRIIIIPTIAYWNKMSPYQMPIAWTRPNIARMIMRRARKPAALPVRSMSLECCIAIPKPKRIEKIEMNLN